MVSSYTGMVVQPNKAIVGANAFAHEAGIHQDGMLKHQATYEIMRPETVGWQQSELVLGKHSGRHALRVRLAELGYPIDPAELTRLFARFKSSPTRRRLITDADLRRWWPTSSTSRASLPARGLQVACGTSGMPTATVRLVGPDGPARHRRRRRARARSTPSTRRSIAIVQAGDPARVPCTP
jgi:2-isopropylmalate synthase